MITGGQIKAARGLLRWTAAELAKRAGIGISTVQRMENTVGIPSAAATNLAAVQRALEAGGVVFISKNGGGEGVRHKYPEGSE